MCELRSYRMAVILAALLTAGCQPVSPAYSPAAERDLTLLKGRTLRLMALAEEPFSAQESAVARLQGELFAARDRAKARPRNGLVVRQWDELLSADAHLLGGFLQRWESETTLSAGFIVEARTLVQRAMDTMIEYEQAKIGGER